MAFRKDAKVAPGKTYVSLRQSKDSGMIQSSCATWIRVGLALEGVALSEDLEAAARRNAIYARRVRKEDATQMERELSMRLQPVYVAK